MWYLAWIVGTLFACAVGVYFALRLERIEAAKEHTDA